MSSQLPHPWSLTPTEAIQWQRTLAAQVRAQDDFGPLRTVAGVDVGFEAQGRITRAAVAVLNLEDLSLVTTAVARRPTSFPYIPGLLSFRELPAILAALDQLATPPDLLLVDGQGLAHPRRLGIACHLGILCDLPTIGVGKSRLVGTHAPVPPTKGAWVPLRDRGDTVGAVLRSRTGVKPLYISLGHRLSLPTALALVQACLTRYRLPEPIRQAHHLASVAPRLALPSQLC